MLERLRQYRVCISWLLLVSLFWAFLPQARADWQQYIVPANGGNGPTSHANVNRANANYANTQYFVWVPPPSPVQAATGENGKLEACVAPTNHAAVAQRDDLTCIKKRLEEIKEGKLAPLSETLQKLPSAGAGFMVGFYKGAKEELEGSYEFFKTLFTNPSEIGASLQAVAHNPQLLLEALKQAGENGLRAVVAYICEPSYANSEVVGNLLGHAVVMVLGAKGTNALAKAIAESNAAAKAAGVAELGAIGKFHVLTDVHRGLHEAWDAFKKTGELRLIAYDGKFLQVVEKDLTGKENAQLVLRIKGRKDMLMQDSEAVAKKMALDIAGAKELPEPVLMGNKTTGIPGEQAVLYKIPTKDGYMVLRNLAKSEKESGPVWTIDIPKGMRIGEGLKEIKIERVPQGDKFL
ncbi:hypothetical protein [Acidithiobacillus sp. AMEEHan]|uniref:hypothetical protein n=1 Tax=Acidithiobacillus sp. AMEEHan TaxID=2994951 RepID=UPI0027E40FF6|nr:hypothetical protein [Acidithiobacillus sp. AMEEHan]